MTESTTPDTPAAPAPAPKSRVPYLIAALVALIVVAGAAVAITLAATGNGSGPAKPVAARTFTASGTLTLGIGAYLNEDDVNCEGLSGYDDIQPGVQVVIYDATGKAVALGQLGNGQVEGDDRSVAGITVHGDSCQFTFSVSGVPAGAGPYSVEVSHRGKIAFDEAQATGLALTLGD